MIKPFIAKRKMYWLIDIATSDRPKKHKNTLEKAHKWQLKFDFLMLV